VCAVAYVLWLEELHRHLATQTQAALFARAMGNDVEIPDPVDARARFDAMLAEEPVRAHSTRRDVLAEAFGLRG